MEGRGEKNARTFPNKYLAQNWCIFINNEKNWKKELNMVYTIGICSIIISSKKSMNLRRSETKEKQWTSATGKMIVC